MIPTLLIVGVVAGVLSSPRLRVLIPVLVAATGLWVLVVGSSDVLTVLGLAVANLAVGAAAGWGLSLAFAKWRSIGG